MKKKSLRAHPELGPSNIRREKVLSFLRSEEPAWKDEEHPELRDGAAAWVRKIRSEWDRLKGDEKR